MKVHHFSPPSPNFPTSPLRAVPLRPRRRLVKKIVEGLAFLYLETSQRSDIDPVVSELQRMKDDMRQDHAEEQSEKKKERRFQLLNTLFGALLGTLFTLLVEHWEEIWACLIRLFQ